jgi:hypothetical protein
LCVERRGPPQVEECRQVGQPAQGVVPEEVGLRPEQVRRANAVVLLEDLVQVHQRQLVFLALHAQQAAVVSRLDQALFRRLQNLSEVLQRPLVLALEQRQQPAVQPRRPELRVDLQGPVQVGFPLGVALDQAQGQAAGVYPHGLSGRSATQVPSASAPRCRLR